MNPEASALKLAVDDPTTHHNLEHKPLSPHMEIIERSEPDSYAGQQLLPRFPAFSALQSLPGYRPTFVLDPNSPSLSKNTFSMPLQGKGPLFMSGGSNIPNLNIPMQQHGEPHTMSTPPKAGTFIKTPISHLFANNRPVQEGQTRFGPSKMNIPWNMNIMQQAPKGNPQQVQRPVAPPFNLPQNPNLSHKKIHMPSKYTPLNLHSSSQQITPQHSHLVPAIVAPPNPVPLVPMTSGETPPPQSKIYAVTSSPKTPSVTTEPLIVPMSLGKPVEPHIPVVESTTRSVLDSVMNAVSWDPSDVSTNSCFL